MGLTNQSKTSTVIIGYKNMLKKEPRIPTLLGLFILLMGLGSMIFLVENGFSFFSKASGDTQPHTVTITNVTDTSFTVSWLTTIPTRSYITYEEKGLTAIPQVAFDERDGQKPKLRQTHSVTVSNLSPSRSYTIAIVNEQKSYRDDRYAVITGTLLPPPTHTQDPAFGTVQTTNAQPPTETLVYLSFDGSQSVSTLVKDDGSWLIPLGNLRSQDHSRSFLPKTTDTEHIFFVSPEGESTVTTTITNDSPLPQINIGENYNFVQTSHVIPTEASGRMERSLPIIAQAQGFPQMSGSANAGFSVTKPTKNAAIPSYFPAFSGTGSVGKQVLITLNGPQLLLGKTKVAANGNWDWTPETQLPSGNYFGTAASFTQNDQPITETLAFTILKSGSQVLADSTPSASLTPTPVASPKISPSPSSTPVPVTGTTTPTFILLSLAILSMFFGAYWSTKQLRS